jgi:hypothetical protein
MATKRIRLEDGKKFYIVFKNPGDPVINLYLYEGREIDLGGKHLQCFQAYTKNFIKLKVGKKSTLSFINGLKRN